MCIRNYTKWFCIKSWQKFTSLLLLRKAPSKKHFSQRCQKHSKYWGILTPCHTPKISLSPFYCLSMYMKIAGWVANSVDPNQMPYPIWVYNLRRPIYPIFCSRVFVVCQVAKPKYFRGNGCSYKKSTNNVQQWSGF